MLEGFYTAASGMLMQQRTLNVLGNNISNVRTPGYRADRVVSSVFEQEMLIRREGGRETVIGKGAPTRIIEDVPTDYSESYLEATERPFDLAIVGDGFFNVKGADGTQVLTRNGNFDIDNEGYLILRGTGRVLGEKGELQVKDAAFTVDEDGSVYDSDGKALGKLLITAPQPAVLDKGAQQEGAAQPAADAAVATGAAQGYPIAKAANGGSTPVDPQNNTPATGMRVYQGQIERANIDLNREYTLMMEAQRAFQSCSSALKIIDEINAKTSQIASIGG